MDDDPLASFFDDANASKESNQGNESKESKQSQKRSNSRSNSKSRRRSRSRRRRRSSSGSRSADLQRKVEDFISENDLDAKCGAALRRMPPSLQKAVILEGFNVRQCQNPSAVVMSRIRRAEGGQMSGAPRNSGGRDSKKSRSHSRRGRRRERKRRGKGKSRKRSRSGSHSSSGSSSKS
eukprot:TRINITY_DN18385_c0_g1_i1.p1 TRINITY_DN18385_c0_g1~~TRINITY_DN18385_c0_g1_i1.p1  ORF type:complete len:197 (-),score=20.05 TRINITY_DN18385_c0_g1_i1:36-572(-)